MFLCETNIDNFNAVVSMNYLKKRTYTRIHIHNEPKEKKTASGTLYFCTYFNAMYTYDTICERI